MNNTVITKEDYDEISGHLEHFVSKCNRQEEEMRYMHDFISWMHLEDKYNDFRKNAHEFQPEDGSFSYYTMDESHSTRVIVCS